MLEIFNYPQVITICLLSMFLLPLVFYVASKPGSKKASYLPKYSKKKEKPLKLTSANKGNKSSSAQAKKSKGKAAPAENATDEGEDFSGDNEGNGQDDEVETRHED